MSLVGGDVIGGCSLESIETRSGQRQVRIIIAIYY